MGIDGRGGARREHQWRPAMTGSIPAGKRHGRARGEAEEVEGEVERLQARGIGAGRRGTADKDAGGSTQQLSSTRARTRRRGEEKEQGAGKDKNASAQRARIAGEATRGVAGGVRGRRYGRAYDVADEHREAQGSSLTGFYSILTAQILKFHIET